MDVDPDSEEMNSIEAQFNRYYSITKFDGDGCFFCGGISKKL